MANQLVEVDGRRRVPLGRIGRKKDTRYLVREDDDGTIVLTPAVVLSEREAAVLANPALIQQLQAGIAAANAGETTPLDWSMFDGVEDED